MPSPYLFETLNKMFDVILLAIGVGALACGLFGFFAEMDPDNYSDNSPGSEHLQ